MDQYKSFITMSRDPLESTLVNHNIEGIPPLPSKFFIPRNLHVANGDVVRQFSSFLLDCTILCFFKDRLPQMSSIYYHVSTDVQLVAPVIAIWYIVISQKFQHVELRLKV
jgi:hypothetical protein